MNTTRKVAAHTPGPWEVRFVEDDWESKLVILMADARSTYPGYYTNAEVVDYDHGVETDSEGFAQVKANARLIAAAPDLLDALRDLKEVVGDVLIPALQKHRGEVWLADEIRFAAVTERVDAAIAKAEGH